MKKPMMDLPNILVGKQEIGTHANAMHGLSLILVDEMQCYMAEDDIFPPSLTDTPSIKHCFVVSNGARIHIFKQTY